MISEVLNLLKDHLDAYLKAKSGSTAGDPGEPKVVFVDGEKMDPITFKLGAVSALLINIEEENTLRPADPYTRVAADGTRQKVNPDIRMSLYVLFVVRFKQYEKGLRYLSQIIQYFQNHRVLNHQNAPDLSDKIEQLIMELTTLSFSEQNEMWNALRTTYHPSVLYKIKMMVFRDEDAITMTEIKEKTLRISP